MKDALVNAIYFEGKFKSLPIMDTSHLYTGFSWRMLLHDCYVMLKHKFTFQTDTQTHSRCQHVKCMNHGQTDWITKSKSCHYQVPGKIFLKVYFVINDFSDTVFFKMTFIRVHHMEVFSLKCYCDENFVFSFPVFLLVISYLDPKFLESAKFFTI